jgi:hypothetical protein
VKIRVHSSAIAFALAVFPIVSARADAQSADTRSLRGRDIAIYDLVGTVTLVAGDGDAVRVDLTRMGRDAAKLTIETGAIRGRETLRVLFPGDRIVAPRNTQWSSSTDLRVKDDGTFNDNDWSGERGRRVRIGDLNDGLEAAANLRVSVPRGQRLTIHLAVGQVSITNVDGELGVDIAAADVMARGTHGTLKIDAGSGSVDIADSQGDLSIDTGSGAVLLNRISAGDVKIDAGSGTITATTVKADEFSVDVGSGRLRVAGVAARRLKLDSGSGRVEAALSASPEDASIETGSGGVDLTLPADAGTTLDIDAGSGGIDSEFPITTTRATRNELRGTIGNGRGRMKIETGSGGVRLRRA